MFGKLGSSAGFTLTEALATVIIVGLVTCILAGGVSLATRQYTQSMTNSEAQMLYSSLQRILDTELRYTSSAEVDSNGNVISFVSDHYKGKAGEDGGYIATDVLCTVVDDSLGGVTVSSPDEPGQLAMCSSIDADAEINRLLGKGAYNYGMKASVTSLTYNADTKYFTVYLIISKGSGNSFQSCAEGAFSVKALNVKNT